MRLTTLCLFASTLFLSISPAQAGDGVPVFKITPIEALVAQASTQASERRTVAPVVRFDPISLASHDELAVSCEPGA